MKSVRQIQGGHTETVHQVPRRVFGDALLIGKTTILANLGLTRTLKLTTIETAEKFLLAFKLTRISVWR